MKKAIGLLLADFRGSIFFYTRKLRIHLSMLICNVVVVISGWFKNIALGSRIRFYGLPVINRYPKSSIKVGNGCIFRSDSTNLVGRNKKCILVTTSQNASIEIGDNSGFNGSVIHCADRVQIGNNVLAGYNVLIDDSDHHPIDPAARHSNTAESKAIIIEDNVWLGINVTVLKGVKIGKNSVIGANSLVLTDVPADSLAIGNPCRVIKKI
jgi:acetyltransferase-like isoleucine patch superfamily enzyme